MSKKNIDNYRTTNRIKQINSKNWEEYEKNELQTIYHLDAVLEKSSELLSIIKFISYLEKIVRETFKKIQMYLISNEKELSNKLIVILQKWVNQYKVSHEITAILFLSKSLYFLESNTQSAKKYVKQAQNLLKQSTNEYFLAKSLLIEAQLYFSISLQKSYSCYQQCVKHCQKHFIYLKSQTQINQQEQIKNFLAISYYKMGLISKLLQKTDSILINLRQSLKYALDLYGPDNPITKRIHSRYIYEQQELNEEKNNYESSSATKNIKGKNLYQIYSGKFYRDQTQNEQNLPDLDIYYDKYNELIQIEISIIVNNNRRQKFSLEYLIGSVDLIKLKEITTNLQWIIFQNNQIDVNETLLNKLLKSNLKIQNNYQVQKKLFLNEIPKNEMYKGQVSSDEEDESDDEGIHSNIKIINPKNT